MKSISIGATLANARVAARRSAAVCWLLIIPALIAAGCSHADPTPDLQPTAVPTAEATATEAPVAQATATQAITVAGHPEEWSDNLSQWLELAYVREHGVAGFTELPTHLLERPDLYTTHAAVEMLVSLGNQPVNIAGLNTWINSLKNPNGMYIEPEPYGRFSDSLDTAKTIEILTWLEQPIPDRDAVTQALLSLQRPNGLFLDAAEEQNLPLSSQIARTTRFVEALDALDALDDPMLDKTRGTLLEYVTLTLSDPDADLALGGPVNGILMQAIRSLARIDEDAVPEEAFAFVQGSLAQIPSVNRDLHSVLLVNNIIDTAGALGIPIAESPSVQGMVRQFLVDDIYPLQDDWGGFGGSTTIEPVLTSAVVRLASRAGIPYPMQASLLRQLSLRRIGNGWISFISHSLDAEGTHYALGLTEAAAFDGYDERLVVEYLESEMRDPATTRSVYHAIEARKSLGGDLPEDLRQHVESAIIAHLRKLPVEFDYVGEYYHAARIGQALAFPMPPDVEEKVAEFAMLLEREIEQREELDNVAFVFALWFLQEALPDRNVIDREKALVFVRSLEAPDGGFRLSPDQPPDIFSTYWALNILTPADVRNKQGLVDFVESMRRDYGFAYSEASPESSFRATSHALWILERFS